MLDDRVVILSVRNWDHYQARKDRPGAVLPWCKLYHESLDDLDYVDLSLELRGLLMEMYKLATKLNNEIPSRASFIAQKLHVEDVRAVKVGLNELALRGFLLIDGRQLERSGNGLVEPRHPTDIQPASKWMSERERESTTRGEGSSRPSWLARRARHG